MKFPDDLKEIIKNSKITTYKDSVKDIDMKALIVDENPELKNRAVAFMNFYEQSQLKGSSKEISAKAVIKLNEIFVRRSILKEVSDYLVKYREAYQISDDYIKTNSLTLKEKKIEEFKSYLYYAANKFGDAKDVKAVEKLIAKIK